MKDQTRKIAVCGMMTAVCTVLMLLGAVLELGIYAAPMFAGLSLVPLGEKWGRKYQALVWIAVSVLSFLLVPNIEESLIFFGLFGWYPILRPTLQKLPRLLRIFAKLLLFNITVVAIESLVMFLLVPESMEFGFLLVLLAASNVVFLLYDYIIPRTGVLLKRIKRT